jgi:hypothetical protein
MPVVVDRVRRGAGAALLALAMAPCLPAVDAARAGGPPPDAAPPASAPPDAAPPHPPAGPFSLQVSLAKSDVDVGGSARVTYRLTNETGDSIAGCAEDWSAGLWWGSAGIRGPAGSAQGSCQAAGQFRLPPRASLTWTSEVKVLNAGMGKAHFVGIVRVVGEPWSGEVRSLPVPVVLRDPHESRGD